MAKKVKRQVPVIKAKGTRVKRPKRKSKGVQAVFEVWTIGRDGYHEYDDRFETYKEAEKKAEKYSAAECPVIVPINIPPMEY